MATPAANSIKLTVNLVVAAATDAAIAKITAKKKRTATEIAPITANSFMATCL